MPAPTPDQIFLVEARTEGINLHDLDEAGLAQLKLDLQALINECTADVNAVTYELSQGNSTLSGLQTNFSTIESGLYQPPQVINETSIAGVGDQAHVISETIAVDISIQMRGLTGNGNDGIGIVYDWSDQVFNTFKFNALLSVSGQKLAADSALLEVDYVGVIADSRDDLLAAGANVLIPDLFDPNTEREPDQVFNVAVTARPADQVFSVSTGAPAPSVPPFVVSVGPDPVDPANIVSVDVLNILHVAAAEPAFVVDVGPEGVQPENIFTVSTGAPMPDGAFLVTTGPAVPDPNNVFDVKVLNVFDVKTSWAPPNKIFNVTSAFAPPKPDQSFFVSVGGDGAPGAPDPDVTMSVTTSWKIPNRIFDVKVIQDVFAVQVGEVLSVSVGPAIPPSENIFDVTTGDKLFDQVFRVTAAEPPIYFTVEAADSPKSYSVIQSGSSPSYAFSISANNLEYGESFSGAVNRSLSATVGQEITMSVSCPDNPLWIKNINEIGAGESDPTWGTVTGQGATSGQVKFRINQPGIYYYQSETTLNAYGIISVT